VSWHRLGSVAPAELAAARLELHHAAQAVAAVGATLLEPQPDDSHPNLGWNETLQAFVGRAVSGGTRAALHAASFELWLLDADAKPAARQALEGRSLDEAHAWLAEELAKLGVALPTSGLSRTSYELPDHPVAGGAPFSAAAPAHAELARWFSNGQSALAAPAFSGKEASELRIWPHHFDLGSLLTLATNEDGSLARSIGLGLSPGDDSYPEPYFYVSPWPYPKESALPALVAGGSWHTEGFTSAILSAADLLEGPADRQEQRLGEFLETAVTASRAALTAG